MRRRQVSAEHVRRSLLAFVAAERAAKEALGGGMFPSAAEVIVFESASDPDLCAELADRANDIDELAETWTTAPMEHDVAEHAAFVFLLRLPVWAHAKKGQDRALMEAIKDPAFLHTFMTAAWGLLERLLSERSPQKTRRRRR